MWIEYLTLGVYLLVHKVGGLGAFFGYFSDPRFADNFTWGKEPGQFTDDKYTRKRIVMVFMLQLQGSINLCTAGRLWPRAFDYFKNYATGCGSDGSA
ncbi:hypothetical protein [Cerasicoccus maritimus]|uniref:hypothetical protein n=1 Tax=Cerasicoccus maritimus TaxID=490089 RepID=UPI002852B1BF|nr:hypothetical protein [Cerasicoccus maritimus]